VCVCAQMICNDPGGRTLMPSWVSGCSEELNTRTCTKCIYKCFSEFKSCPTSLSESKLNRWGYWGLPRPRDDFACVSLSVSKSIFCANNGGEIWYVHVSISSESMILI
jgi:hypothetical protein